MNWLKPHRIDVKPFYLYRTDDVSGVSGTGVVAVGVVLPSGKAVMEWNSKWPTVTIFNSIDHIVAIHGHGGRTQLKSGVPAEHPPTGKLQTMLRRLAAKFAVERPIPQAHLSVHENPPIRPTIKGDDSLTQFFSQSRWSAGIRALPLSLSD